MKKKIKALAERWNAYIRAMQKGEALPELEVPEFPLAYGIKIKDCLKTLKGLRREELKEKLSSTQFKKKLRLCSFLIKHNYIHANTLEKLLSETPEDIRESIAKALNKGVWPDEENGEKIEEVKRSNIATALRKLYIGVSYDGKLKSSFPYELIIHPIKGKIIWVREDIAPKLEELASSLEKTSAQIQLMNAQRQIRKFSDEEEKQFEHLQKQYLELSNKINKLIEDERASEQGEEHENKEEETANSEEKERGESEDQEEINDEEEDEEKGIENDIEFED